MHKRAFQVISFPLGICYEVHVSTSTSFKLVYTTISVVVSVVIVVGISTPTNSFGRPYTKILKPTPIIFTIA